MKAHSFVRNVDEAVEKVNNYVNGGVQRAGRQVRVFLQKQKLKENYPRSKELFSAVTLSYPK